MKVDVQGLESIQRILDNFDDVYVVDEMAEAVSKYVVKNVKAYPPKTDANRRPKKGSGRSTWYERGFGTRSVTGASWPTSEQLNKSWDFGRERKGRYVITNDASYSRYVHDKEMQARFHRARGWLNYQDVIKSGGENIARIMQQAWKRAMRRYGYNG